MEVKDISLAQQENERRISAGERLISITQEAIELTQKGIMLANAENACDGLFGAVTSIYKESKLSKVEECINHLDSEIKIFIDGMNSKISIELRKDLVINQVGLIERMDLIFKSIGKINLEKLEKELYKIEDEILGILNILREREKEINKLITV